MDHPIESSRKMKPNLEDKKNYFVITESPNRMIKPNLKDKKNYLLFIINEKKRK